MVPSIVHRNEVCKSYHKILKSDGKGLLDHKIYILKKRKLKKKRARETLNAGKDQEELLFNFFFFRM